jgi:hypothetical protein
MPEIEGDEDATELGEHDRGLLAYQGAGTASVDVGRVVTGGGVPRGRDGMAGELERNGSLDRPGRPTVG